MLSYSELQGQLETSESPNLAILPVGCYEQHGPVLPLDTDNLIAGGAARRLAERLRGRFSTHVFPCLSYSTTEPNVNYAGTVSVAADPFRAYLKQVCEGILATDFDALLVLNSHGSIVGSLKEVAFGLVMAQFRGRVRPVRPVLSLNVFDFDAVIAKELEQAVGRHADWKEFLLLYDLLGTEYFTADRMSRLRSFCDSHPFNDTMPGVIGIPAELRTTDGVQGRPLPYEDDYAELAKRVWKITLDGVAARVERDLTEFRRRFASA